MTAMTVSAATAAKDSLLRFAMRLDAVGSGLTGIVGVALAPRIAELSGTTPALEYSMGTFFIAYGVVVYGLSLRKRVRTTGVALVVGNLAYTVLAVAAVLAGWWPLTTTGIVLTLASGVFTLLMADLQYLGLRRMRA
jgi:peptidoglycan/LPS O-acetylase OafA/YrhL